MTADYPTDQIPATPEYVLAVLDSMHRMFGGLRRVSYRPIPLPLDMTIAAWWRQLGYSARAGFRIDGDEFLNDLFGLDLQWHEWVEFLRHEDRQTLGDLGRFVADRMRTREAIRPWRPLVGECRAAGAFLALKSMLAATGVDVSNFAPSTPLTDPIIGKPLLNQIVRLIRLAPETFPPGFTASGPAWASGLVFGALAVGMGLFVAGFATALIRPENELLVKALWGTGFAAALLAFVPAVLSPAWPVIPGLHTYGDLACALAGQQPRRRIQPSS